ncbi:MAG: hypothetical protein ACOYK8_00810 [Alphaproteobacteria bacterium]
MKKINDSLIMIGSMVAMFLVPLSSVVAASSPCGSSSDCKGWNKLAEQHYDATSPYITIWEKNGERFICSEPGPSTCVSYGGNLELFKADAAAETIKRKQWHAEAEAKNAQMIEAAKKARRCNPICGQDLITEGWQKTAECTDGHQWRYIIEKNGEQKSCSGINAIDGLTEDPCQPYHGNKSEFKQCNAEIWKKN